jgi:hypothetical protein
MVSRQGDRSVSVVKIADIYRGIFKFGVFNVVQSTCFDKVNQILSVSYWYLHGSQRVGLAFRRKPGTFFVDSLLCLDPDDQFRS